MLGSVQLTLQTSGATYNLYSTGNITGIDAAAGVSAVQVNVHTDVSGTSFVVGLTPAPGSSTAMPPLSFYGHGDVGDIVLPAGSSTAGSSTLSVASRGDLSSISGPSGTGKLWAQATSLFFGSLSGSITGLDHIQTLQARGWLGDSASDQVVVNAGIDTLSAYGVAATVTADRNYDQSDPSSTVSVGHGGVSGVLSLGNVLGLTLSGAVNQVKVGRLMGDFLHSGPGDVALLAIAAVQAQAGGAAPKLESLSSNDDLTKFIGLAQEGTQAYSRIKVYGKLDLTVTGGLAVSDDIIAENITRLDVSKKLSAMWIEAFRGKLEGLKVGGDLSVSNAIRGKAGITGIDVGGKVSANAIIADEGDIGPVNVKGDLAASFQADNGTVKRIVVGDDFHLPPHTLVRRGTGTDAVFYLVRARRVDAIEVKGDLGTGEKGGTIEAKSIGQVKSIGVQIKADKIIGGKLSAAVVATDGGIDTVEANGVLSNRVSATGGNIGLVQAKQLRRVSIVAERKSADDNTGGSIGRVKAGSGKGQASQDVTIRAANYLGEIRLNGDMKDEINVTAQAGAEFDANNKLTMMGGQVVRAAVEFRTWTAFEGKITFSYGKAKPEFRVSFTPDGDAAKLLEFTRIKAGGNVTQTWRVNRKAGMEMAMNVKKVSFVYDTVGNGVQIKDALEATKLPPNSNDPTTNWQIIM